MHLNDLLFLLPKISFFPNLHPEMFPEYVFERGFTNSASFFTEKRGASFSQFPLDTNTFYHLCIVYFFLKSSIQCTLQKFHTVYITNMQNT